MNPQPTKQALTAYRSWLQRMVDETQEVLDRSEGDVDDILAINTTLGVALGTFDAHFPAGDSKPEPVVSEHKTNLRDDIEALKKARPKPGAPEALTIRITAPLTITIGN